MSNNRPIFLLNLTQYVFCLCIYHERYLLPAFLFLKDHRRAKPAKHATDACIVAYSDVNDVSYNAKTASRAATASDDTKTASDAVNLELQRQVGQHSRDGQRRRGYRQLESLRAQQRPLSGVHFCVFVCTGALLLVKKRMLKNFSASDDIGKCLL